MSGYLKSISVGTKTALAFVTISLLMVAQAILAMRNMSEMTSSFHVVSESGIPSVKNAGSLTQTITELQYREYQLAKAAPAEVSVAQQQLKSSRERVSQSIAQAQALADTDEERDLAQLAETQWSSYIALGDRPGQVALGEPKSESTHRFDDLLTTAESIVRVNANEAVDATHRADLSYRRSYDVTMVAIGVAVLATLTLGWGLSRGLSRRLAELLSMSRRIVDAGPSVITPDAAGTDEIDQLTAVLGQLHESRHRSLSVSRLTHELRTPLNSILGFAELMLSQRDAPLPEAHEGYVQQMVQSGKHLIRLIDGLLDLSKMEAGLAHLRMVSVDVVEVIEEASRLILPLAQARELHVQFTPIMGEPRWALADRTRLLQVVLNLLSNAVKYNRHGGTVEIAIQEDVATGRLCIAIGDDGPGIAPHHRQELFKPFQRLGKEAGAVQGTGLGLAITNKLVHLMHGDINVESTLGVGSRFTVSLPGAPAAPSLPSIVVGTPVALAPIAAASTPLPAALRPLSGTVLHVDDDEVSRILMQAYFLSHPGVRLLSADGAASGIQLAGQEKPDLILVDICMPEVDGFEFLRSLRDSLDLADVRCVAVSANASNEDAQTAFAAGFDGYLMKPLSMPTLFGCVDQWLQTA
ncbi:ATP-binding protein [Burkholderiaceae bacterium UC74_6]